MSHYKQSTIIVVFGVSGVIGELPACRPQLTLLLSALLFVVVEFSTLPAFDRVVAMARTGRMAPPSTELPRISRIDLPMVGVVFSCQLPLSPSAESTSISSSESSSIVRLGVEDLTIRCIAPFSSMIFFHQEYRLKVEKGRWILPCENGRSNCVESWSKSSRHIYTISSSSITTSIKPRASHSSLIFKV